METVSKLKLTYASPNDPISKKVIIRAIELMSGRTKLERLYNEIQSNYHPTEVWQVALDRLSVKVDLDPKQLEKIPMEGPLVFLANHPFGVIDGLILANLVAQKRRKFFIIVNEVLCKSKRLSSYMLPIDFRESKEALFTNIRTKQEAIRRLKAGEALAIFPAGGVATSPKIWGKAEDLEWKRFVAKLIQQSRATVVPIFVHGQNSRIFHLASKLSTSLRLGLLLHETRNKIGKKIKVTIGDPIDFTELAGIKKRQDLLDHLKQITFSLSNP